MRNFKRIFELIRRTGDRLVVTDPEGEETFVVMDLDDYEMLLDLGMSDCSDFADCSDCGCGCDFQSDFEEDETFDPGVIDEEFLFESEPVVSAAESPEKQLEQILPEIDANLSEETAEKDQGGEEEQFYLEPVE